MKLEPQQQDFDNIESLQDRLAREDIIRELAVKLGKEGDDWTVITLDILLAYDCRKRALPDWWVYSRFVNVFGTDQTNTPNTWLASDTLDALLYVALKLQVMMSRNWLARLLNWRRIARQRKALLDALVLLSVNDQTWNRRNDFLTYRGSR